MTSTPTDRTVKGPSGAVAEIQAFAADLVARPLPPGVSEYVFGDSERDPDRAAVHLAAGTSSARWGESPHHYAPALALDVFPILAGPHPPYQCGGRACRAGDVSPDPAHYAQIVAVAEEHGLVSGRTWSDWPHVQVPGWRSRRIPPDPGGGKEPPGGDHRPAGPVLALLVLLAGAAMYLGGLRP